MRAVLDPNVLVSALLSPAGALSEVVARGLAGSFEIVASDHLLAELRQALAAPKLRRRILPEEADAFVALLSAHALSFLDVPSPSRRSADPHDDYLVALAEQAKGVLVSGDRHLLDLAAQIPVRTPRDFLSLPGQ